ncbi:MAG: helix-turn-helix transcriptional regulator [Flavobacterium sp.]|nr:helix-turn-helix transcriptional regulator [Flavobacterium sp.]
MQKVDLPELFIDSSKNNKDVYVHFFQSNIYNNKTKITLNTNLISFLLEGNKELYHNNLSQKITENEFVLAKSGNCLMSENLSVENKYSSLLFFFNQNFIIDFKRKHALLLSKKQNLMNEDKSFLVLEYDVFTKNFVSSLQQLLESENSIPNAFITLKLEEIMLYLVQKHGSEILFFFDLESQKRDKKKLKLQRIVENNIYSKLSVEELAFLCHMSLSTFKREFNKIYKMPPSNWIQEKRLEKSAHLLSFEKERPSDVYHLIGYESLSSFTQSFKQKFGTTPKKYQLEVN